MMRNDSRWRRRDFGTIIVLGLGAMSLAGAFLYSLNRPAGPKNLTVREQARPSPAADLMKSSPSLAVQERGMEVVLAHQAIATPTVSTESKSDTKRETIEPNSTSASAPPQSNQALRLEGKGSVVVLGREAAVALELSQHPEKLSKLIQSGSLFTASRGTVIKLLQGNRLGDTFVIKVRIIEGSMVGQEGWAQTWQVSP